MTIDKFRKQPVVIEATRLLGEESATEIIEWAGEENIKRSNVDVLNWRSVQIATIGE